MKYRILFIVSYVHIGSIFHTRIFDNAVSEGITRGNGTGGERGFQIYLFRGRSSRPEHLTADLPAAFWGWNKFDTVSTLSVWLICYIILFDFLYFLKFIQLKHTHTHSHQSRDDGEQSADCFCLVQRPHWSQCWGEALCIKPGSLFGKILLVCEFSELDPKKIMIFICTHSHTLAYIFPVLLPQKTPVYLPHSVSHALRGSSA